MFSPLPVLAIACIDHSATAQILTGHTEKYIPIIPYDFHNTHTLSMLILLVGRERLLLQIL